MKELYVEIEIPEFPGEYMTLQLVEEPHIAIEGHPFKALACDENNHYTLTLERYKYGFIATDMQLI